VPAQEVSDRLQEIETMREVYKRLLSVLPSFKITDETILPYGLKPHTRSISWLVEQVITQQTKYNKTTLGLDDVNFDLPDTCLHDCEILISGKKYFVNIKVHNIGGKQNKNDIAAVEKLFMQYNANPQYNLIYACFGISFDNLNIKFSKDYLTLFSPVFMPIYVNPRNDKIQAFYEQEPIYRTRAEFLSILKEKSTSIVLSDE